MIRLPEIPWAAYQARLTRIYHYWRGVPKRLAEPKQVIKICAWATAALWIASASIAFQVGIAFEGTENHYYKQRVNQCKDYRDRKFRYECITEFTIGWENRNFYRLMVVFFPPLLLIPVARAANRWVDRRTNRRTNHRIDRRR